MSDRPDSADEAELAPPAERENLEGWIPALATDGEIREALEKAFDYRGDVTITLKDGRRVEGSVFDRRSEGQRLGECYVRVLPKGADEKVTISYDRIAGLAFSGKDTAAGKSWETWVRKYNERKAAGERNIGLEPEKLD